MEILHMFCEEFYGQKDALPKQSKDNLMGFEWSPWTDILSVFFAFYLALYLTFSLFSRIYWKNLLVPFSGIPSDNIFWHVIWRSVPAHKPAKSLGAPIPFRPGKPQRAGELAARKLAIICWHESGEVSEEAKSERRKEGRMQNIWLSPGTRGKNLQDKSKNSS